MKNFNTFSEAKGGLGLTIFDIDKTLFNTDTKVKIINKDGEVIKTLDKSTGAYNSRKVKDMISVISNLQKHLLKELHRSEE